MLFTPANSWNFNLSNVEPAKTPEVAGAELLWYEILGEPIPRRYIYPELGQFNLSGQPAKVLYGRRVSANSGAFAVSGQAAFRRTYSLKANFAAFVQAGQAAGVRTARRLVSDKGTFAHAGHPTKLLHNKYLRSNLRSAAVSGVEMNFKFQRFLRPLVKSLLADGQAARLLNSLYLRAGKGSYALNAYYDPSYMEPGFSTAEAKLLRLFHVNTDPGAFTLGGSATVFRKTKLFIAGGASFSVDSTNTPLLTKRRFMAETVGLSAQTYDIGFSWQHVMRPLPVAFNVAGLDAALKKIIYFFAGAGEFASLGYGSRPYFSSLPQAEDYVVRPLELRAVARQEEMRSATRPEDSVVSVHAPDTRGVVRPREYRTSERGEEDRFAEHE